MSSRNHIVSAKPCAFEINKFYSRFHLDLLCVDQGFKSTGFKSKAVGHHALLLYPTFSGRSLAKGAVGLPC